MKLVDLSVKRPVGVIMLVFGAIVLGAISLMNLAIDLFPEMDIPVAVVATSYTGASPQEVEQLITRPIESSVSAIEGISSVESTSSPGSSLVILMFDWGKKIDDSMNDIRERVDQISGMLPDDAGDPMILKIDPQQMPVMWVSLSGAPLERLQDIAEGDVQPVFERVSGVASVSIEGGKTREIQVLLDQAKLASYNISSSQVIQAIGSENRAASAGNLSRGNQELQLRIDGQFTTLKDIEETQIHLSDGRTIRVSDVALVSDSFKTMMTKSLVNGENALVLSVMKQSDGNAVQVANEMYKAVDKVKEQLGENIEVTVVMDTSIFIKSSIKSVVNNMIVGAVLATIILLLFLRSIKTTLVIGLSIPIAVISTFTLMYFTGETLNILSMGGLALGLGMMVDSAIVILENIFYKRQEGYKIMEAAREGASELAPAVFASTMTTVVVFLPIVFVEGLASMIFRPLAYTVAFALLASLVVSLTLVPMLSSKMLTNVKVDFEGKNNRGFDRILNAVKDQYGSLLAKALKFRKTVVGISFAAVVGSIGLVPFIGFEFIPASDQGQITINAEYPVGSKLSETELMVSEIDQLLEQYKDIIKVSYVTVGGGTGFGNSSTNRATYTIQLIEPSEREMTTMEFIQQANKAAQNIVGAEITVSAEEAGFGTGSPVQVNISGPELDVLNDLAQQLVWVLEEIDGTTNVESSVAEGRPELTVKVNRQVASQYGLTYQQIMNEITLGFTGQVATRYKTDGNEYDVRVMLPEDSRQTIRDIETTVIRSNFGVNVPLTAVAELRQTQGPAEINRSNQERQVRVTSDIVDRDLGSIITDLETRLNQLNTPDGYRITIGGQAEDMAESFTQLGMALVLSIFLVYMVMAIQFESFLHPFTIMFSLPVTLVGIIVGLFITGMPLSITAFIGVIMLAGIVVNNAIILVSYINILRDKGIERYEAIIEAGMSRLRPILMTTLTTVLAMIPLALGIGEGAEMQAPMAVVIIFGLSFSTLFTLVLVPVVYVILDNLSIKMRGLFNRNKKEIEVEG